MKPLKQENLEELKEKVYKLVSKTAIEIGHKADGKTMAALSKIFAQDLIQEKRFGNMTFNQVADAYYEVHTLNKPKGNTLWYQEPLKQIT